jgi:single-strand DNA-binding protein
MLNKAIILGNVGRISTSTTNSGLKVSNLSVATSENRLENGQKTKKTTWHNVTLFDRLSELVDKYVSKGDKICIEGKMDTKKFIDKNGIERDQNFILATNVVLLGNKGNTQEDSPAPW